MPRLNTDTRAEIRTVALELFSEQGYEQTSLREIAERLGITKAALYYHFSSKSVLLGELVHPLIDELRAMADRMGESGFTDPRAIVEEYFDLCFRYRQVFIGLLNDVHVRRELELVEAMIHWRERVDAVLVGSDAPADRVRSVVALGGLQDTIILFPDVPAAELRAAAVDAAMRALLPETAGTPAAKGAIASE